MVYLFCQKTHIPGRAECRIGREISNRIKKCRIGCRIGHEIGGIKANHMPFDTECVSWKLDNDKSLVSVGYFTLIISKLTRRQMKHRLYQTLSRLAAGMFCGCCPPGSRKIRAVPQNML